LRKIEYYHQGSISAFHIMYRDSEGIWDGIQWGGQRASFFALRQTEEGQARKRLLEQVALFRAGVYPAVQRSGNKGVIDERPLAVYEKRTLWPTKNISKSSSRE
jgi:hypothetical protein